MTDNDDYLAELHEERFQRRRHNRLMRLPPGHPDEEQFLEGEDEDDDSTGD